MISRSIDDSAQLPRLTRVGLSIHLAGCRLCRRYRKQVLVIGEALRLAERIDADAASPHVLPADARERIKQRLPS
jgi:hypothetical protein